MRALSLSVAFVVGVASAQVQCVHVAQPGPGLPGPIGVLVTMATPWDPDGVGPLPEVIVLGGSITAAGTLAATNVVAYDPVQREFLPWFAPLPSPPRCAGVLATGDLVVATDAGQILRWNGSAWQDLGAPIAGHYTLTGLANGDLIAGGFLGLAPSGLLRWDGVSWQQMGSLTAPPPGPTMVNATIQLDNGDVVVTGNLDGVAGVPTTGLARWNGATWSAYPGIAVTRGSDLLALPGNRFLVSGALQVGGSACTVARWDGGSWTAFPPAPTTQSGKLALRSNGDIVSTRGGRWFDVGNGTAWTAHEAPADVFDILGLANGDLLVCGRSKNEPPHTLASRWDGSAWQELADGIDSEVDAVTGLADGRTVIGGRFTRVDDVVAQRVAISTPTGWAALGAGLPDRVVKLAASANGDVIAAIWSAAPECIRRWDGTSWSVVGPGTWQPTELTTAMLRRGNGDLVAAALDTSRACLLRTWNGTAATRAVPWRGSAMATASPSACTCKPTATCWQAARSATSAASPPTDWRDSTARAGTAWDCRRLPA
jgi:hypothetical protein